MAAEFTTDEPRSAEFSEEVRMRQVFELQHRASRDEGYAGLKVRYDRLDRAIGLIVDHQREIGDALMEDFGNRARAQTGLMDLTGSISVLKDARKRISSWMRPQRRRTNFPMNLFGGRSYVLFQPLGVVGVIAPWNVPCVLTFAPLAGILAAGNCAMVKLSEHAPHSSHLIRRLIETHFAEREVAAFEGGSEAGRTFSLLPFDHLLFTGGAAVARDVMASAAKNLTPVTLELGGKAAVVIGRSASLPAIAPSILNGKLLNGGQVCMGVDYVLLPHEQIDFFVELAEATIRKLYPSIAGNPDYTAMISKAGFERMKRLVAEARGAGSRVIQIEPELEGTRTAPYRYPPTLIVNPPEDIALMREEIFGPLLPIVGYESADDAISYVNRRTRALAIYYFGHDAGEKQRILTATWSGGVTINEVMMHPMMVDLPSGGVGESGMGRYIGFEGFQTFSNAKSVYEHGWLDLGKFTRPPYGKRVEQLIARMVKR